MKHGEAGGDGALAPLRVLDFSRVLAGPFATMMLADLGAAVTKVERPGGGDETRSWGPPYDERGEATYFQAVNRNKGSVVLDLAREEGRAEARRLALAADVLVENFRPGVMARLGLDHPTLAAENPGLVYCSITGFGSGEHGAELTGLLAARPAAEWAELLTAARVPAGVVNDLAGAFALATSLGLDPTVTLPRPDGGTVELTRNPIRLAKTPPSYRTAPPPLPRERQ